MSESTTYWTPTTRKIIDSEVNRILLKHGVSPTSPVKDVIRERLSIGWAYQDISIRVSDEGGTSRTVDEFIDLPPDFSPGMMRLSPRFVRPAA
jgi:hypothetical protein